MKLLTKGLIILITACMCIASGCSGKVYSGNEESGFSHFPTNPITPERAIELARPYLNQSYELREKDRNIVSQFEKPSKLIVWVILKGDLYYITKDYYNYKTVQAYMSNAVRINKKTGKVIKP